MNWIKRFINRLKRFGVGVESATFTPTIDSTRNSTLGDVIGNKSDSYAGKSIYGILNSMQQGLQNVLGVYPTLASGVTITASVSAWTLGSFSVVIPANTITKPFDLHETIIEASSANDSYEIVLYGGPDGSEVEIARSRFVRLSAAGFARYLPLFTPIQNANTQIKAKLATAGGGSNATISLRYQQYN